MSRIFKTILILIYVLKIDAIMGHGCIILLQMIMRLTRIMRLTILKTSDAPYISYIIVKVPSSGPTFLKITSDWQKSLKWFLLLVPTTV